jgi:ribosome-associated toxin RatA of RatAB toxin-antitoxin module
MKTPRYFALLCLLPAAALFAALPSLAAQEGTHVGVRQNGMQLTVDGWLETRATPDVAWKVLTDYSKFPEFVPGIRANRVTRSEGNTRNIEQKGEIISGMFRLLYEGEMLVEEFTGTGLKIQFTSGPFKGTRGEWRLEQSESKKPQPLRLVYELNMDMMKTPFPPPLAPAIAEQQVRTWVEVFAREMEARMDRRKAK